MHDSSTSGPGRGAPNELGAAKEWHALQKTLTDQRAIEHGAAGLLLAAIDKLRVCHELLLVRGFDASNPRKPRAIPIPVALHPKTKAELRRWNNDIEDLCTLFRNNFSVVVEGTVTVRKAVGDQALSELLSKYAEQPIDIARLDLEGLALSCFLWLVEAPETTVPPRMDVESAALAAMERAMETALLDQAYSLIQTSKDEPVAEAYFTGWALANISRKGQAGGRIRQALTDEGNDSAQFVRFVEVLRGAMTIGWKERSPREPLRPAAKGVPNLRRRVGRELEQTLKNAAREAVTEPEVVSSTPFEELSVETDDIGYAGWEARQEAARQKLDALEQVAMLSPGQAAVWQLVRRGVGAAEIARELEISLNNVHVQKHEAIKRLREAKEAAGF